MRPKNMRKEIGVCRSCKAFIWWGIAMVDRGSFFFKSYLNALSDY